MEKRCGARDTVLRRAGAIALLCVGVAGCSSLPEGDANRVNPATIDDDDRDQAQNNVRGNLSDMFGGGVVAEGLTYGDPNEDTLQGSEVNRFLWRASIDTLSFLPIASTDPFTGVIATDWGATPAAPQERFKVTAYVTDTRLTPQALRVAVFKETLDGEGRWRPGLAAPETARQIEDAILLRARQLRIADVEGEG